ncbi:MAG: zinc ribbon domain-containing protein [Bacteroidaceae bacterium]|nr:zinc ribbon domain-containing protein [Bacteroidaceae bacterium]
MKCINEQCHREIGDVQFCPYCGAKQEKPSKMHCVFCGAEQGDDFVFCSHCGNKSVVVLLKEMIKKKVKGIKTELLRSKLNLGNAPKGVKAVDLNLPSGTLWATANVGATRPEEKGGYYAWGETEEKTEYSWKTYIHCDGSYDTCHDIGSSISGTEFDVAHVKWGGNWRMPTKEQFHELFDECEVVPTSSKGIPGYKLIGPNDNSIFLPTTGFRWHDSIRLVDTYGNYWYSWKPHDNVHYLSFRNFLEPYFDFHSCVPFYGQCVRPVYVE